MLIQDADSEYDPQDYPGLIQPILDGKANMVYGSRFRGARPKMRLANYLANRVFAFMATVLYRTKVTDEATCYKAFGAELSRVLTCGAGGSSFVPRSQPGC